MGETDRGGEEEPGEAEARKGFLCGDREGIRLCGDCDCGEGTDNTAEEDNDEEDDDEDEPAEEEEEEEEDEEEEE